MRLALLLALAGCGGPAVELWPLPAPSVEVFERVVSPILADRCASGGCHGEADRPYALYAVAKRRAPPTPTFSRAPLSDPERRANYDATLGFVDAALPLDTTLLQKALAAGGPGSHGPGAVFVDRFDPECAALIAWMSGEGSP